MSQPRDLYILSRAGVDAIKRAVDRAGAARQGQAGEGGTTVAGFWGKITGSTQDGTNKRWIYDIAEVKKTSAGYGGWTQPTGAITGEAYNLCEDPNGSTGLFGNGVDSANLSGTFDIQPIPDDSIVWLWVVHRDAGAVEFWFERINGIDGACS